MRNAAFSFRVIFPVSLLRNFLGREQDQLEIPGICALKQAAKPVQQFGVAAPAAPSGVVVRLQANLLGRFRAIVEKRIHRNLEGSGEFLESFDGGNGVAILDARDVTTEQAGSFFDVTLRKLFTFAQRSQPFADNHVEYPPAAFLA
jgi:hypothetical protein